MDQDDLEQQLILDDQRRPTLNAETFSPRMRFGLLLMVLFGEACLGAVIFSPLFWEHGLLDVDMFLAVYLGGLSIAMGFYLTVIFGGLVNNDERLAPEVKRRWLISFLLAGPVTIPAFWYQHVWRAPYVPWTEPQGKHAVIPENPLARPSALRHRHA